MEFSPICVICILDPNSKEAGTYQAKYVRHRLRVYLEHIIGNMWRCPRCGAIHYDKNFYTGNNKNYKRM